LQSNSQGIKAGRTSNAYIPPRETCLGVLFQPWQGACAHMFTHVHTCGRFPAPSTWRVCTTSITDAETGPCLRALTAACVQ
jgi:hypothetical protein